MSISEDRDEFNSQGLRGLLRKHLHSRDDVFIKIDPSGNSGTVVPSRPPAGSGPYLHFLRGEGAYIYQNSTATDRGREEFVIEL